MCDCMGEHYVHFVKFERDIWDDDNGESDQLYVTIGLSEMSFWKDRFKAAWKIIRFGEYENHGVLIDPKQLENIRDYISDVLKHWNENFEKVYFLSEDEVKKLKENSDKIDYVKFVGITKKHECVFNDHGIIVKIPKGLVEDVINLTVKL